MAYTLDLAATNPLNKITTKHLRAGASVWYFRPIGGAFFTKDLVVTNTVTGQVLQPNIHYRCLDLNNNASMQSGKEVCDSLVILTTGLSDVTITRRVIGGQYEPIGSNIDTLITDQDLDRLNSSTWGQIIGLPIGFSPDPHAHLDNEVYGFGHVVYLLSEILNLLNSQDKHGFGIIYQYIDKVFDGLKTAFDARISNIQTMVTNFEPKTKFQVNQIVAIYGTANPNTLLGYGTWVKIEDTFLFGVTETTDLGTTFKVGSDPNGILATKVFVWRRTA